MKNAITNNQQLFRVIKREDLDTECHTPKGFTFDKSKSGNYRINSNRDSFSLHYYIEPKMLFDPNVVNSIVHSTKNSIRSSEVYIAYIAYLRNEIGLVFDAFNGNITQDKATLVMHHGPIFSLEDYVHIVMQYQLDQPVLTNTFLIAKQVMEEHAANNIQVCMLTKNNHALVHNNLLHLRLDQCWGNLVRFINKYKLQIQGSPRLMSKIHRYKEELESADFHDTSIIQPGNTVDWSKPDDEYRSFV
jgi:hypothetical protein